MRKAQLPVELLSVERQQASPSYTQDLHSPTQQERGSQAIPMKGLCWLGQQL